MDPAVEPFLISTLVAAVGGLWATVLWLKTRAKQRELNAQFNDQQRELEQHQLQSASLMRECEQFRSDANAQQTRNTQLQVELSGAQARAEEREQSLKQQLESFEANRQQLRIEFENLSREFLTARDNELQEKNAKNIGAILKPLSEKIDGFQRRVNEVHGDMLKNTSALTEQIRSLEKVGLGISSDATNLTKALKGDKKLVGNWGEAQLERTLELAGLRPGEHYDAQPTFKDEQGQRFLPDFVIRLPEGKNLIVDSKVSLIDYEAAVAADSEAQAAIAISRHVTAVKAHIDSLANKDYSRLPGMDSPDFVLMFMPVEPAYIEVMKNHRELFSYGYQKGVVMVSHTTLMPILRTVSNLWMVERSNAEAREIADSAGDIYNSVSLVAERLLGLGATLHTASRKYNDTVTALAGRQGLHSKVERFQQISQKANRPFPDQLSVINDDTDDRLLKGLFLNDPAPTDAVPNEKISSQDSVADSED
jgi:DNA recombination protein RmuC